MISAAIFYARLPVCKQCEYWKGACLKGHVLQGSLGCPLQKFEGVDGVGCMEDREIPVPELPNPTGCCGKTDKAELRPMSWPEVVRHLIVAVQEWKKAGFPLLSGEPYDARIRICKRCPKNQYFFFQCRHCRCVVYSKARLATEVCPYGLWPK